jgi:hypothetical protein
MATWTNGIFSACGAMGREIESRLGIMWQLYQNQSPLNYFAAFN